MINKKTLTTAVIILAAILVVLGIKFLTQGRLMKSSIENARTKGRPSAEIKVIEYIDLQCPMCAVGAKKLKEYIEQYPDKIYLEVHFFPLDMHKHAFVATQYAVCSAEQGKFWEMQDLILDKQKSWADSANAVAIFDIYAKETGLDADRLKACLSSKDVDRLIEKNKKEGKDLGIRSTPTYFINGEMVVGIKILQEKMDALLGIPKAAEAAVQK